MLAIYLKGRESDNLTLMSSKEFLKSLIAGSESDDPLIIFTFKFEEKIQKIILSNEREVAYTSIGDENLLSQLAERVGELLKSKLPNGLLNINFGNEGTDLTLVWEIVKSKRRIVIFGAGHVGQALALISKLLGYDVVVVDDRVEFACRERFPDKEIEIITGSYNKVIESIKFNLETAVVIVTRGHQFDELCLSKVLKEKTGYIGMIGSKRRVAGVFKRLREVGYEEKDLERVFSPIGLEIGARSPQEIAIAILAQIISTFNYEGQKRN